MTILPSEKLSEIIFSFAKQPRSVLFTGAGVGKKVGYPLWGEYIEHLAGICTQFNADDEALLMRSWVKKGKLIDASGIYERTVEIPQGERTRHLAEPFKRRPTKEELEPLSHLFKLPFEALVTTNYDSSQHSAYVKATGEHPLAIERESSSMLAATDLTSFYIARIHGCVEAPNSMILYPGAYEALKSDEVYQDFLLSLFKSRPCLFVGFSFVDPAIEIVLETYKRKAQKIFSIPHIALLPADAGAEILASRLSELNIKAHYYDPADGHKSLWRAIRIASAQISATPVNDKLPDAQQDESSRAFRRFLSFTYAQVKLAQDFHPLLENAREGIILGIIQDNGDLGATHEQIIAGLREALTLDQTEANHVASDGTARLYRDRQIRIQDDRHFIKKKEQRNPLQASLTALCSGILDRLKVQFGISPNQTDKDLVHDGLEHVFMMRAWDLGAHYAGGGGGYGGDMEAIIQARLVRQAPEVSRERLNALGLSCVDLLRFPSSIETGHLAEISRAAFSLQLVLSSPRQSLFKTHALPQRVYFDASILLPAIVPGHPFHKLYRDTIDRLVKASRSAGIDCKLYVGSPFLNEIISHRQRALDLSKTLRVDDPEAFKKTILAFGAENINVFIGGYSGISMAREKIKEPRISFQQYLNIYAPYGTENALDSYLRKCGFEVVQLDFRQKHNSDFVKIFSSLLTSYEKLNSDLVQGKERILVEHEAMQLVQLALDARGGYRSIFVSNDKKLRLAASCDEETRKYSSDILPPQGFIGLVDIVVGSRPDPRGLARLLWASSRRENDQILRDYLVKRALLEQDVAQAKASAEVINEIISESRRDPKALSIDLTNSRSVESAGEAIDFIDRFEDRFFAKMRQAIERQEQ